VRKEALALGSEYAHELWREIQDLLELRLTLAQRLRQLLLLGDIDPGPQQPLEDVAVDHRQADATNMTNHAVGAHDPFREVNAAPIRQHRLNLVRHEISVFGVDERQILRDARRLAARLEAVDPEQLGRPVLEAYRFERPGTRVRKPLSLRQVELCLLAFIDIDTGPVPLDDVASSISQWNFPVEQPTILAVGPRHAGFDLE